MPTHEEYYVTIIATTAGIRAIVTKELLEKTR